MAPPAPDEQFTKDESSILRDEVGSMLGRSWGGVGMELGWGWGWVARVGFGVGFGVGVVVGVRVGVRVGWWG